MICLLKSLFKNKQLNTHGESKVPVNLTTSIHFPGVFDLSGSVATGVGLGPPGVEAQAVVEDTSRGQQRAGKPSGRGQRKPAERENQKQVKEEMLETL